MRKSLLAAAATAVLALAAPAQAQMAVYDATSALNMAKQLAESAKQLTELQAQLSQLQQTYQVVTSQLRKAEEAYAAVTGARNLGDFASNPEIRKYLPADVRKVYDLAKQGGYAGISGSVGAILEAEVLAGTQAQRDAAIRQRQKMNAASNKLVGMDGYEGAQQRLAQLDQLQQKISDTEDPKAIAELQARIAVEQAAIQNEAVKLQLLQMMAAAEDKLIEEQKRANGAAMFNPANNQMSRIKRN